MNRLNRLVGPLAAGVIFILGFAVLMTPRPDPQLENLRTGLEDHHAHMDALAGELRLVALCLAPGAVDSQCAQRAADSQPQEKKETGQ